MRNTTPTATSLIIDGLKLSTTADDLRQLFLPFGSIVSCHIAVDRYANSLRYGYVVMDTEEDALKAIDSLNGKSVAGLSITVAKMFAPLVPCSDTLNQ